MRLVRGRHKALEEAADEFLREQMSEQSVSERSDILTWWKQVSRWKREVYVTSGMPDGRERAGMFKREANTRQTHLNSRDGHLPTERSPSINRWLSGPNDDE